MGQVNALCQCGAAVFPLDSAMSQPLGTGPKVGNIELLRLGKCTVLMAYITDTFRAWHVQYTVAQIKLLQAQVERLQMQIARVKTEAIVGKFQLMLEGSVIWVVDAQDILAAITDKEQDNDSQSKTK